MRPVDGTGLILEALRGLSVQRMGGPKSEDTDHRTFCRRFHRRRTSRACAGCARQDTGSPPQCLQETSRGLRLHSAARDATEGLKVGLSGSFRLPACCTRWRGPGPRNVQTGWRRRRRRWWRGWWHVTAPDFEIAAPHGAQRVARFSSGDADRHGNTCGPFRGSAVVTRTSPWIRNGYSRRKNSPLFPADGDGVSTGAEPSRKNYL